MSSFLAPPCGVIFRREFSLRRNNPIFLSDAIKGSTNMCVTFELDPMSNFGFFGIFLFSTCNLANKPIFKTLQFRRRRSDPKSFCISFLVCVRRCRVQGLVLIGQ